MNVIETNLPGVLIFEPKVFGDQRGFFVETFRESVCTELGIPAFVQDNQSRSSRGVLRGLHYQLVQPQGKLVRATVGEVFDIAVDLRPGSETLGKWVGRHLSDENKHMLWIPPGFGHAFLVLSETAIFNYKCTDYYLHEDQHTLAWDDPSINVQWPELGIQPSLSEKDLTGDDYQTIMERIIQKDS